MSRHAGMLERKELMVLDAGPVREGAVLENQKLVDCSLWMFLLCISDVNVLYWNQSFSFGRTGTAGQKKGRICTQRIYTSPYLGPSVYRRLLTAADTRRDKCTLIYGGNNAVLCEPGTLKTGVTVIWTRANFMCVQEGKQLRSMFVKAFGWGSKMLGSLSNPGSLADNRDRFLMPLPICRY